MAWQQKRAHARSTGENMVFTQTVAHSPGVYTAQTWNGSCSDTSRLEAIAQMRHADVLVLPLWRYMWAPRPWSVTFTYCGLKSLQRELMVFRCTPNRRATSRWCVPARIIPVARWRASVPKRDMLCVHRQWSPVKKCFFSGTSKHSQHPCMLTRCGTRMTEAANSKWPIYNFC